MVSLWMNYALFHESSDRSDGARSVYRAATRIPLESAEELVSIWIGFIKKELRLGNGRGALAVCRNALTVPPPGVDHDCDLLPEPSRICENKEFEPCTRISRRGLVRTLVGWRWSVI